MARKREKSAAKSAKLLSYELTQKGFGFVIETQQIPQKKKKKKPDRDSTDLRPPPPRPPQPPPPPPPPPPPQTRLDGVKNLTKEKKEQIRGGGGGGHHHHSAPTTIGMVFCCVATRLCGYTCLSLTYPPIARKKRERLTLDNATLLLKMQ